MGDDFLKKRKFLFLVFLAVIAVGIVALCFFLFRGPAVGTVSKKEPDIFREEIPVEKKVKEFHGTNFSFSLPESFEEKRHETFDGNSGNILEQAFFSEGNAGGRKIAIVVDRRPPGGIRELSAFAFRTLHSEMYVHKEVSVGKWYVSLFSKNEAVYEITGFFEENDLIASVSITSAVLPPEKIKEFFFEEVQGFEFSKKSTSSE